MTEHKCYCGRVYPVKWQLQAHWLSYEAVGKCCPKVRS